MKFCSKLLLSVALLATILSTPQVSAQSSLAISGRGREIVTLHAVGAQIYECKPDTGDKLERGGSTTWQFREPIATLFFDGKSVGRHYAGPNWDHMDGSGVKGRVTASAPGATSNDIPWLKIDVIDHRNSGILSDVTGIRRINTKGGVAQGSCGQMGEYLSVPYSADYVFVLGGM
jgi:Protein of unknown function (DUF3455)